jgi:hypothetical protein
LQVVGKEEGEYSFFKLSVHRMQMYPP